MQENYTLSEYVCQCKDIAQAPEAAACKSAGLSLTSSCQLMQLKCPVMMLELHTGGAQTTADRITCGNMPSKL